MPIRATLDEAAALVKSGDHVVVGCLAGEPQELVRAICDRAGELRDVTICAGVLLDGYPVLDTPIESFRFRTWLMPTSAQSAIDPARVDLLPMSWSQVVSWLESWRPDIALVQLAEGPRGNYSLGVSVSYARVAVDQAKLVVGVVNPKMPFTYGDSEIPASAVDVVVHGEAELPVLPVRAALPEELDLALSVAEVIPDGSLLQVGVGVLPNAVMSALVTLGRKNLRQFSMLSDSFLELIRCNAVPSAGPAAIIGEVVGTPALYDYVRENPRVAMADGRRTHDVRRLLAKHRLVVLGSALQVDLFGQANLEILGGAQFSGVGGALDFSVTAALSPSTADSVLMLSSMTSGGASKIVARLDRGPVSLPRTLVRQVVTEHGRAVLDGLSVRERADRLASIAHPACQDGLSRYIRDNGRLFGA